jgi:hypothetical protein
MMPRVAAAPPPRVGVELEGGFELKSLVSGQKKCTILDPAHLHVALPCAVQLESNWLGDDPSAHV